MAGKKSVRTSAEGAVVFQKGHATTVYPHTTSFYKERLWNISDSQPLSAQTKTPGIA